MIENIDRRGNACVSQSSEREWATLFMRRRGSSVTERPTLPLLFVVEHVALAQGLSLEQMRSNRHYQCVRAKHLAIYLARKCTPESLNTIARAFGMSRGGMARVINSAERQMAADVALSERVAALQRLIIESWSDYLATATVSSHERGA